MKAFVLCCLISLSAGLTAQEAQESSPQVPPSSRVVGYDQYNQPATSDPADTTQHPNDLELLTGKGETSVPAAQRTGYGAPQVYVGYPEGALGYGYSARPTFLYRRRAPLFHSPNLLPFNTGFVPRRTPARPFFFSPNGLLLPFGAPVR